MSDIYYPKVSIPKETRKEWIKEGLEQIHNDPTMSEYKRSSGDAMIVIEKECDFFRIYDLSILSTEIIGEKEVEDKL